MKKCLLPNFCFVIFTLFISLSLSAQITVSFGWDGTGGPACYDDLAPNPSSGFPGGPIAAPVPAVATITDVNVTIVWQKRDAECDMPVGGGCVFHEETQFNIIAPGGNILLVSNDFPNESFSGCTVIPQITTVFDEQSLNFLPAGGAPFSTTYNPVGDLNVLNGTNASGNWQLYAEDNVFLDDLVVFSWSVEVTYIAPEPDPCDPQPTVDANAALDVDCLNLVEPIKVAIVVDESGSVGSGEEVQIESAIVNLLSGLNNSTKPIEAIIIEFDEQARRAILAGGYGDCYNPVSSSYITDGVIPYLNNVTPANSADPTSYDPFGLTNWQDGLLEAGDLVNTCGMSPDLVVFFSDDPSERRNSVSMPGMTIFGQAEAMCAATIAANDLKAQGAHIFAVGIDNATGPFLQQISGPAEWDGTPFDFEGSDWAYCEEFTDVPGDFANIGAAICPGVVCPSIGPLVMNNFADGDEICTGEVFNLHVATTPDLIGQTIRFEYDTPPFTGPFVCAELPGNPAFTPLGTAVVELQANTPVAAGFGYSLPTNTTCSPVSYNIYAYLDDLTDVPVGCCPYAVLQVTVWPQPDAAAMVSIGSSKDDCVYSFVSSCPGMIVSPSSVMLESNDLGEAPSTTSVTVTLSIPGNECASSTTTLTLGPCLPECPDVGPIVIGSFNNQESTDICTGDAINIQVAADASLLGTDLRIVWDEVDGDLPFVCFDAPGNSDFTTLGTATVESPDGITVRAILNLNDLPENTSCEPISYNIYVFPDDLTGFPPNCCPYDVIQVTVWPDPSAETVFVSSTNGCTHVFETSCPNMVIQPASMTIDTDAPSTVVDVTISFPGGACGNFETTVTVFDPVRFSAECPADQTYNLNSSCGVPVATFPDWRGLVLLNDNCLGSVDIEQEPAPGTPLAGLPDDVIPVDFTITNNTTDAVIECSTNIILIDTQDPHIYCPDDQRVPVNELCEALLPDYTMSALAFDNCAVADDGCDMIMGFTGDYAPENWTETIGGFGDVIINESSLTLANGIGIGVYSATAPVLCDGSIMFNWGTLNLVQINGEFGYMINGVQTQLSTGAPLEGGVDVINVTAGDVVGFYFDTNGFDFLSASVVVDFLFVPTPTCEYTITQDPAPGTPLVLDVPVDVTLTVTDCSDNTGSCTFVVTAVDVTPPTIVDAPSDVTFECGPDNDGQLANWLANNGGNVAGSCTVTPPPFSGGCATDNCDDNLTWTFELLYIDDHCFNTETRVYEFTVTDDSGNSTTARASFTTEDTTNPVFDMPLPQAEYSGPGYQCQEDVPPVPTVTATDACGNVRIDFSETVAPGTCEDRFVVTRTWVAYDDCGNSDVFVQDITINDDLAPVIVGGADITITCDQSGSNNDDQLVSWLENNGGATATDNCSPVVWSNNYDVANFETGCNNTRGIDVIFTASDACGNIDDITLSFTVIDEEAPVFENCPRPDIVENAETDHCDAYVNFSPPVAFDNCSDVTIHNRSPFKPDSRDRYESGDRFPVGTTIMTYVAEDACGNTSVCKIKVIVNDFWDEPTISCPEDITMYNDDWECAADVTISNPVVSDVCPDLLITTYQIEFEGEILETGLVDIGDIDDTSNKHNHDPSDDMVSFNFPVGKTNVTYCVQDQPLLLITEVTQDVDHNCGGMDPDGLPLEDITGDITISDVTVYDIAIEDITIDYPRKDDVTIDFLTLSDVVIPEISLNDVTINDYIEITNFGPASYDLSCLVIERSFRGRTESFVVPEDITVAPGEVFTLGYLGFDDITISDVTIGDIILDDVTINEITINSIAVDKNFFLTQGRDYDANTEVYYSIYYGENLIDDVTISRDAAGGMTRIAIKDTDSADDWELAGVCNPITIGEYNSGYPTALDNGTITSLQSVKAKKDQCTVMVEVFDNESPICKELDGTVFGSAGGPGDDDDDDDDDDLLEGSPYECNELTVELDDCLAEDVTVYFSGNMMDDVTITLTSPAGTTLELVEGSFSGEYDETHKEFYSEKVGGTWTLNVAPSKVVNGFEVTLDEFNIEAACLVDWTPPTDATISNDDELCTAEYTWTHPYAVDNCKDVTISVAYVFTPFNDLGPNPVVPEDITLDEYGGYETTEIFSVGRTSVTYTLKDQYGNESQCGFTVKVNDDELPTIMCPAQIVVDLDPGECRRAVCYLDQVITDDNCGVKMTMGTPPNCFEFEIGMTPVDVTVTDIHGNTNTCQIEVIINEFVPPTNEMACIQEIHLSLDQNCEASLTPEMLLTGDLYRCYENYCITITDYNGNVVDNYFDTGDIGHHFSVSVSDCLNSGNSCWGTVWVEEKLVPEIECPKDITISCAVEPHPDNTGPVQLLSCEPDAYTSYQDETEIFGQCEPITATITRTWTVMDAEGNSSSCVQKIDIVAVELTDITFPPDLNFEDALECADVTNDPSLVDPENTGYPMINGWPIVGTNECMISINKTDEIYDICAGGYELLRTWKIRNMCGPVTLDDPFTDENEANPIIHTQVIKVFDTEPPVIVGCPTDITVTADKTTCEAWVDIPLPALIEDACSDADLEVLIFGGGNLDINGSLAQGNLQIFAHNLDLGDHEIKFIATDECGAQSECSYSITVIDDTPPIAIANQYIVISLTTGTETGEARALLYAKDIDNGSYDSCTDVHFEIRRDSDNCDVLGNTTFNADGHDGDHYLDPDGGAYVTFCCDDLMADGDNDGFPDGRVKVWFRVWDDGDFDAHYGSAGDSYTDAWVYVTVQDKIEPELTCPADITVDCNDDVFDLELMGSAYASGICGERNVSYIDLEDSRNSCGAGTFTRKWFIDDNMDGIVDNEAYSCYQYVRVIIEDPFTLANIHWPPDYNGEPGELEAISCMDSGLLEPSWDDVLCSQVAVKVEVDTFTIEEGGCYKILKYWTIIDWCQFDQECDYLAPFSTCPGVWNHLQEIKISDETKPILQGCNDVTVNTANDCIARNVSVSNSAVDPGDCPSQWLKWDICLDIDTNGDCDYVWTTHDGYNDSPFDHIFYMPPSLGGEDVTIPYDNPNDFYDLTQLDLLGGDHQVTWTVEDGCGNKTTCITNIHAADLKAPTPYCINDLATALMESVGSVTIWAEDFNAGAGATDNCTPQDELRFSFSGDEIIPSRTFVCAEIEDGVSHVFDLEIWVWDNAGNRSFCTAKIKVDDNVNACIDDNDGGMAMISGLIQTEYGDMIEDVEIELNTSLPEYPISLLTTEEGVYAFDQNPLNYDYELRGEKNHDFLNGISTLDMLLIQRHILGLTLLDSPYKVIASDVNNDEKISATDILELRKLILNVYTEFPNNDSWRFVDAYQEFENIHDPWPFTEILDVSNLSEPMMQENYIGVKIGDVSGDAEANSFMSVDNRSANVFTMNVDQQDYLAEDLVNVEFKAAVSQQLFGFQMTLEIDNLSYTDFNSGVADLETFNFGLHRLDDGLIMISWHTTEGVEVQQGDVLFSLRFNADNAADLSENLELSSLITEAEAYVNDSYEVQPILLNFENIEMDILDYKLYQNEPNPFTDYTTIAFKLPKSEKVSLRIFSKDGKLVKWIEGEYEAGYHEINLSQDDLEVAGLYYYQMEAGTFVATKNMIVIQ